MTDPRRPSTLLVGLALVLVLGGLALWRFLAVDPGAGGSPVIGAVEPDAGAARGPAPVLLGGDGAGAARAPLGPGAAGPDAGGDDTAGGDAAGVPRDPSAAPPVRRVSGRVVDPVGRALEGASVFVRDPAGTLLRTRSAVDGRFALEPLPVGPARLWTYHRDHHEAEHLLDLEPGELRLEQDLVLRPQQVIRVRLETPGGEPAIPVLRAAGVPLNLVRLHPVATAEAPGPVLPGASTIGNERYGVGNFWDDGYGAPGVGGSALGTVTLHEDGPAYLSLVASDRVLETRPVDAGTEEVTFTLDADRLWPLRCGVEGWLLAAEDRTPLAARAELRLDKTGATVRREVGLDGRLEVDELWPGRWRLSFEAEGRAATPRFLDLEPGTALDLGPLLLPRAVSLSGRVLDADGEGVEAVVQVGLLDGAGGVRWSDAYPRSDAAGRFRIEGLEGPRLLVRVLGLRAHPPRVADPTQRGASVEVDASGGDVEGLELRLRRTTPVSLVTPGLEEPWPRVGVVDENGRPFVGWDLGRWGTESVLHLFPGTRELVVERAGEVILRRTVEVGTEPLRLELDL